MNVIIKARLLEVVGIFAIFSICLNNSHVLFFRIVR